MKLVKYYDSTDETLSIVLIIYLLVEKNGNFWFLVVEPCFGHQCPARKSHDCPARLEHTSLKGSFFFSKCSAGLSGQKYPKSAPVCNWRDTFFVSSGLKGCCKRVSVCSAPCGPWINSGDISSLRKTRQWGINDNTVGWGNTGEKV